MPYAVGQAGVADELTRLHGVVGRRLAVGRERANGTFQSAGEAHQVAEVHTERAGRLDRERVVVVRGARSGVARVAVAHVASDEGDIAVERRVHRRLRRRRGLRALDVEVAVVDRGDVTARHQSHRLDVEDVLRRDGRRRDRAGSLAFARLRGAHPHLLEPALVAPGRGRRGTRRKLGGPCCRDAKRPIARDQGGQPQDGRSADQAAPHHDSDNHMGRDAAVTQSRGVAAGGTELPGVSSPATLAR